MSVWRFIAWMLGVALMIWGTGVASGQNPSTGSGQAFPNRPIRIVTNQVGGGGDFTSRLIAPGITGPLGQPVIVENRGGVVMVEIVSKAPPDGYTLMLTGGGFMFGPLLQKLPYDPVRDFSPITLTDTSLNVVVVHPTVAANSVKELIALAKAKPGALNYSVGTAGGASHLAAELFKSMAGVNIVRIAYKGSALAITGVLAGEVQVSFGNSSLVAPHLKSGKLRGLAVTSAEPSPLFPGLPTVAATGLPGYEAVSISGIWAPAKTPATVIRRLNQEIVRVLNSADVKEKFLSSGAESASSSPEEFAAKINAELIKWGKVIKEAGIRVE